MVSLARNEFHECTASKDIQLFMQRNQTKENMEVVCHYLTVSAKLENTFLEEIMGKTKVSPFLSKGTGKAYLEEEESFIKKFLLTLQTIEPFSIRKSSLIKPFTNDLGKPNIRNLLNSKHIGKEMLLAYIRPRFCDQEHVISFEKKPMKRKMLATFATDINLRKKYNIEKDQKQIMELLVAGVVKLSQKDGEPH